MRLRFGCLSLRLSSAYINSFVHLQPNMLHQTQHICIPVLWLRYVYLFALIFHMQTNTTTQ